MLAQINFIIIFKNLLKFSFFLIAIMIVVFLLFVLPDVVLMCYFCICTVEMFIWFSGRHFWCYHFSEHAGETPISTVATSAKPVAQSSGLQILFSLALIPELFLKSILLLAKSCFPWVSLISSKKLKWHVCFSFNISSIHCRLYCTNVTFLWIYNLLLWSILLCMKHLFIFWNK